MRGEGDVERDSAVLGERGGALVVHGVGRHEDRPNIDPFSMHDAETLIAAIHRDWGEAQGNYDEFRFFTGLRPSEEIALVRLLPGLRRAVRESGHRGLISSVNHSSPPG